MPEESRRESAGAAMERINQAWLDGKIDDLGPMVHPEIVTVFPGFSGKMQGRDTFLAGFRNFCQSARIHEFREQDRQVDIAGNTAVVTFHYEMLYERLGERYRATGRDLWVLESEGSEWIAVWRAMLEMAESAT
jgi:hypothetical protein